jgi:hypothetical protein
VPSTLTRSLPILIALALLPACKKSAPPPDPHASYTLTPINPDLDHDQIAKLIEEMYGLASGERVEVVNVIDEQHVYRVTAKLPGDRLTTVIITRDGRYLAEAYVDVAERRQQLMQNKKMVDCLAEKNVRIFVNGDDPRSSEQLAVLGASARAIAIDCAASPENCARLGIKTFPAIVVSGDQPEAGLKPRAWFETRTGCK